MTPRPPTITCKRVNIIEFGVGLEFSDCSKMLSVVYIFFLCVEIATITVVASPSHGSKPELLHSYMEQMYNTRARGNGNGSFTISLRNQKILATSIRGFQPEKNGKYSIRRVFLSFV